MNRSVKHLTYRYDVALSFAGEDRAFVEAVAKALQRNELSVFYDKYEQPELWGKNLYTHLYDVYRNRARFCIIFVSQNYVRRTWCTHELAAAQDRAISENCEYILPVRFDSTELPGLLRTVGYIDLSTSSPEDLALLASRKVTVHRLSDNSVISPDHGALGQPTRRANQTHESKDTEVDFPAQLSAGWKVRVCMRCSGEGCWSCHGVGGVLARDKNRCPVCFGQQSSSRTICTFCMGTGYFNFLHADAKRA